MNFFEWLRLLKLKRDMKKFQRDIDKTWKSLEHLDEGKRRAEKFVRDTQEYNEGRKGGKG